MSDTEVNEDQNAQHFFLLREKRGGKETAKQQQLSRSLIIAEGATAVSKAAGLGAAGAQGKKITAICTTAATAATRLR